MHIPPHFSPSPPKLADLVSGSIEVLTTDTGFADVTSNQSYFRYRHPFPPPAEMSSNTQAVSSMGTKGLSADSGQLSTHPAGSGPNSAVAKGKKRKNHRGGKKKKRRQSFGASTALDSATAGTGDMTKSTPELQATQVSGTPRGAPFYRMGNDRNLSESSLESEALLDHRFVPLSCS